MALLTEANIESALLAELAALGYQTTTEAEAGADAAPQRAKVSHQANRGIRGGRTGRMLGDHRHRQIFSRGENMHLEYDPRYNIAYLRFLDSETDTVQTLHLSEEMNIDLMPDGRLHGIELLNANEQLFRADAGQLLIDNSYTGQSQSVRAFETAP
jgi:uncharacterized protein YuzE